MLYLDTGGLVKLYYPEAESPSVAAAVAGEAIGFTALHALELTTALQAKVFRGEATPEQASAAHAAVEEDLASGKLCGWIAIGQRVGRKRRRWRSTRRDDRRPRAGYFALRRGAAARRARNADDRCSPDGPRRGRRHRVASLVTARKGRFHR